MIIKAMGNHYNIPREVLEKYLISEEEVAEIKKKAQKTTVKYKKGEDPDVEGYGECLFCEENTYIDSYGDVWVESSYYYEVN